MTSIDSYIESSCFLGGGYMISYGSLRVGPVLCGKWACIKLNPVCANPGCTFHHTRRSIQKNRDPDALFFESGGDLRQKTTFLDCVPTLIRCQGRRAVWHKSTLMRFIGQYLLHKLLRWIPFNIQLGVYN